MSNLSFARIMYGTNKDLRDFGHMNAAGLAPLPVSASSALPKFASGSLEELLHKAWAVLSSKH